MASDTEVVAMRRAIALSALARGTTSPNPPVGCVILDGGGTVVGEGYHLRKGGPHAEGRALAAAGPLARGATAVVTLEPCNHVGRAPACRQLLLDAGVARVVIAVMDPTSRGEGGAAVLAKAGVSVETGVLDAEARLVLGPWLEAQRLGRPHVTWAFQAAMTGRGPIGDSLIDALRGDYDLIVHADGTVLEGVPGGHGADFTLPPHGGCDVEALADLWRSGARTLLLNTGTPTGERYMDRGCVDAIVQVLEPGTGQRAQPPALLPPGFQIFDVGRCGGAVIVQARAIRVH